MSVNKSVLSLEKLPEVLIQTCSIRQQETVHFKKIFAQIVEQLVNGNGNIHNDHLLFDSTNHSEQEHLSVATTWIRQMLNYNVPFGKLNRGLSLVVNFQILNDQFAKHGGLLDANNNTLSDSLSSDNHLARVLGWCVEMFQATFLITDDIMDNSITRRGRPCWYRNKQVGLIACNDATLVEACIFQLMHKHLHKHPCYNQLVHLMHEGFRVTASGQCLDVLTESAAKNDGQNGCNLSVYQMARYQTIVKYKTAFYTFVLPTRLALYLANKTNPVDHRIVESIMLRIGELFQIEDDYLDCFGDPELMGKIGTDIRDSKCSWMMVKAVELANEEQRQVLREHYGKNCDHSEMEVKRVYNQLALDDVFHRHQQHELEAIIKQINTVASQLSVPVEIFNEPLSHVYKRDK